MKSRTMDQESLSALMDDELTLFEKHRQLTRLMRDHELQQQWQRYHLVRDELQHHLPQQFSLDLADSVAAVVAEEPLPQSEVEKVAVTSGWRRQLAAVAMVASVAGVALIALFVTQNVERSGVPITVASGENRTEKAGASLQQMRPYLVNHTALASGLRSQGFSPYVTLVGHHRQ
ncbi:MAG: sigma-E factor negative regulatory protein [Gammaproteobacteria bacterium]|nr:sigma-E factor negative regulatory protein [Gammaproteobacteria bacterium]